MLPKILIWTSIFILELGAIITPIIEHANNTWVLRSYVIRNNTLLGDAVYSFVQSELPLCSRRYKKINTTVHEIKNYSTFVNQKEKFYLSRSLEQELHSFCVIDSNLSSAT